jgi:hypothetical protein
MDKFIRIYKVKIIRIFFPALKFIKDAIENDLVYVSTTIVNRHYSHENTRDICLEYYGDEVADGIDDKLKR